MYKTEKGRILLRVGDVPAPPPPSYYELASMYWSMSVPFQLLGIFFLKTPFANLAFTDIFFISLKIKLTVEFYRN